MNTNEDLRPGMPFTFHGERMRLRPARWCTDRVTVSL